VESAATVEDDDEELDDLVQDSAGRIYPRNKTFNTEELAELNAQGAHITERPGVDYERPKTRADCENGERPCPFVSCRFHLFLDLKSKTTRGPTLKMNFPSLEGPEDMTTASCALDVADEGAHNLEDIGEAMNLTRERVRQIETMIFRKARGIVRLRMLSGGDDRS